MQERWVADRAMLQQLMQKHPEWTQQELADWIGRSLGWVKKWVKRLREAPPGDARVLFGKPFGRKTPYPQTDPRVEERILAIRDTPLSKVNYLKTVLRIRTAESTSLCDDRVG
jgi:hypothetical protein